MFDIFGAAFPPPAPIGVKFCVDKRTHVQLGLAKFLIFLPVSKFNTGSLPLRGILPVMKTKT